MMFTWKHAFVSALFCWTFGLCRALVLPAGVVHGAIGATSGCLGALSAYPLDTIKSQLQTEVGREKYAGGFDAFVGIIKSSPLGPLALYRGAFVNVLGIAPEKTIKLGVNNFLRGAIEGQLGFLPILGEIFAGGSAGLCQVIATNPLEVIKVKLQTSDASIWEIFREIGNVGKLYQGAEACIVRDVVFSSFLFPVYSHAKVLMPAILMGVLGGHEVPTFWSDLLAGSVAAAPAAFIATPADTVKTRMQQARASEKGGSTEPKGESCQNGIAVTKAIISDEGICALFSGWFERVLRSIPQFGVTLAMFDVLTTAAIERGLLA